MSALLAASHNGDEAAARALLQEGTPVNVKCEAGWTPLMRAAAGRHKGLVNLLLTATPPASVRAHNKFGKTALHYICGMP